MPSTYPKPISRHPLTHENGGVMQTVAVRSCLDTGKINLNRAALNALQQEISASLNFEIIDFAAVRNLTCPARTAYLSMMALI